MKKKKMTRQIAPCPPKPDLCARPLLSHEQAVALAGVYKILANDTRLRLLHALVREGKLCVSALAEKVGMKPQAVSNQLQRLTDRHILSADRNGNHINYRIIDPCVASLIDRALCLTEETDLQSDN